MHENDISEKIIGAAIEVHRILGPGLLESVYEEALCHELHLRGLKFVRQQITRTKQISSAHLRVLCASALNRNPGKPIFPITDLMLTCDRSIGLTLRDQHGLSIRWVVQQFTCSRDSFYHKRKSGNQYKTRDLGQRKNKT